MWLPLGPCEPEPGSAGLVPCHPGVPWAAGGWRGLGAMPLSQAGVGLLSPSDALRGAPGRMCGQKGASPSGVALEAPPEMGSPFWLVSFVEGAG